MTTTRAATLPDAPEVPPSPEEAGATEVPAGAERLFTRENLPVVIGIVSLVTLAAFENRAVTTILPTVVRELDGWALFGASTGAALVTLTIAMAWSGSWTDRVGPRLVLLWGVAAFVLAQVISGLAPTMTLFVAGRAVSGAAEALIDTALMVLVAQALPEELRAKVFASFAAAWILPSLLGPSIAGAIDALWGLRVVFGAPLVVVPIALLLLRRALRGDPAGPSPVRDGESNLAERRRVVAAVLLAVGLAVTTFSAPLLATGSMRSLGLAVIGAGTVLIVIGAVRVLPHGMARLRRGLPSVIAVRLLVSAGFMTVGGLIPLMLVQTQGASTAVAGISLSVTGCFWAAGSWVNGINRVQQGLDSPTRARLGTALIALGSLGPVLLTLRVVGLVPGMALWAVAALGMGIVTPTLSTQLLALAPPSEQGQASAANGLAMSTGAALATGVTGAAIALEGARTPAGTYAVLMLGGTACALLATLAAGRTRRVL